MAAICDLSSNFSITLIDLIVVHLFLLLLELSFELLGPETFDRHEFYMCVLKYGLKETTFVIEVAVSNGMPVCLKKKKWFIPIMAGATS
jgi:hypothetical protein